MHRKATTALQGVSTTILYNIISELYSVKYFYIYSAPRLAGKGRDGVHRNGILLANCGKYHGASNGVESKAKLMLWYFLICEQRGPGTALATMSHPESTLGRRTELEGEERQDECKLRFSLALAVFALDASRKDVEILPPTCEWQRHLILLHFTYLFTSCLCYYLPCMVIVAMMTTYLPYARRTAKDRKHTNPWAHGESLRRHRVCVLLKFLRLT